MDAIRLLIFAAAIMSLIMLMLWALQQRTQNAGPVDLAWSAGIGLVTLFYAAFSPGFAGRRALVAAMTGIWSMRLSIHLWRRIRREPEDGRYQAIREEKGVRAASWFFWFYQFQAVLVILFSVPPLIAMRAAPAHLTALDFLGALIAVIAIVGESVADLQLSAFRARPENRNRTCREGLWRYSRHPNYFFEWIHWFAYIAVGATASFGWLTLAGPILMLFFLFKITGIPPTEARALASRGNDYREYQRTTSVFFPWIPKETSP
ncbi:MAG: DUF1295 domain-containing protein [Phycisphaerae bacterium]|nr:DUF1295 domain-containing protein [Phycisphaerae bacterium]